MPDTQLIEQIADTLGTSPGLVEKDWHVVRALKALSELDLEPVHLVFTGGTCLSKAWGIIQRFSEDIDFKADVPTDFSRPQRRELRAAIETALTRRDFSMVEPAMVRDEGRFFILKLDYASAFPVLTGLRPHIQVEVSLRTPKLAAVPRSVQSFVGKVQGAAPEVSAIGSADPIETAAEKLSALAWRVLSRQSDSAKHDASMIRHLYDLAALEGQVTDRKGFDALTREIVGLDQGRGDQARPKEFRALLQAMLDDLRTHVHWERDYETFIRQVSYATDDRAISFKDAMAAVERLVLAVNQPEGN